MEGLNSINEQQSQEPHADETGLVMNSMKSKKPPQGHRFDLKIDSKNLKRKMDLKEEMEMPDNDVQLERGMKSPKVGGGLTSPTRMNAEFEGSLEKSSMKQTVSAKSEKGNPSRALLFFEPIGSLKLDTDLGLKCDERLGCFTCCRCGQFISYDDNVYMYMDWAFCSTKCRGAPLDFDRRKKK